MELNQSIKFIFNGTGSVQEFQLCEVWPSHGTGHTKLSSTLSIEYLDFTNYRFNESIDLRV